MKNKKITEREYGKNYPYTKDNVTLKVAGSYPNAIYIEDKKFVGYTTEILKPGMDDILILFEGFKMYAHEQHLKYLRMFWCCYLLMIGAAALSLYVALNCKHLIWLAWLSFFYCFANLVIGTGKCLKIWRGR